MQPYQRHSRAAMLARSVFQLVARQAETDVQVSAILDLVDGTKRYVHKIARDH